MILELCTTFWQIQRQKSQSITIDSLQACCTYIFVAQTVLKLQADKVFSQETKASNPKSLIQ